MTQSKRDLYGNAAIGPDVQLFECHNCIVHTAQEKKVVVQGLDGYIVAENNNTLLICKLSEEQRIKQFSEPKP
jgi:mannose-1-phosphate guanylyltransferase